MVVFNKTKIYGHLVLATQNIFVLITKFEFWAKIKHFEYTTNQFLLLKYIQIKYAHIIILK